MKFSSCAKSPRQTRLCISLAQVLSLVRAAVYSNEIEIESNVAMSESFGSIIHEAVGENLGKRHPEGSPAQGQGLHSPESSSLQCISGEVRGDDWQ